MEFQTLYGGYNNDFAAFPKSYKSKKVSQNKNNSNRNNMSSSKGNYNNRLQQAGYNQQQYNGYPSWNVFNTSRPSNNGNYAPQYNNNNYAKNFQLGYNKESFSDKASRSTGASDNENGFDVYSELTGFKIVQSGKVIHNETNEEFDSYSGVDSDSEEAQKAKFASSVYTIGPNARDISIPSFADE